MKTNRASQKEKLPDLGAATPNIVDLYESALAERGVLRKWIKELSSKSNPTVRDRLCSALYRHQLSFREPPLAAGVTLTAITLWQYWIEHPQEFKQHQALQDEIMTYLKTNEEIQLESARSELKMLELVQRDPVTYVALYPLVKQIYRQKPGRPVERRLAAVQALQMQIDKSETLKKITTKVCDCGRSEHDTYCEENLRQSIISLKKLLRKFRIPSSQS